MKKALSFILAVLMLLSVGVVGVNAAGDTIATATPISLNTQYSGNISDTNSKDIYKMTLVESGRIS